MLYQLLVVIITQQRCCLRVKSDAGELILFGQCDVPNGLTSLVAIAVGPLHTAVLLSTGEVRCWGDNTCGQCDVLDGITNAVAISCGWGHTAALLSTGEVRCWGKNIHGQCNVPDGIIADTSPYEVAHYVLK